MTRKELLFWELFGKYDKLCDAEIDLHIEQLNLDKRKRENTTQRKTIMNELLAY